MRCLPWGPGKDPVPRGWCLWRFRALRAKTEAQVRQSTRQPRAWPVAALLAAAPCECPGGV